MTAARRIADDQGETLLELLIALVIMSIAVVAIVSGIAASVLTSDIHRKQATAGAIARDDAEALVSSGYSTLCSYTPPTDPTYPDYTVQIGVSHWDSSATPNAKFVSGCGDTGLHKVSITVSSPDSRASESVDVVIRSAP